MIVKEILIEAATLIAKDDIIEFLTSGITADSAAAKREANILLRCYNLVENEIALEYKPLITQEKIYAQDGIIEFSALKNSALDILAIYDEYKNKLPFKMYSSYLKTAPKSVEVKYTYMPERKTIDDKSSYFGTNVSMRILAMGAACEYLLVSGLYADALMWDKRYKDSLLKICASKTSGKKMPSRNWR